MALLLRECGGFGRVVDGGLVLRERAFRASVEAMDATHRGHVCPPCSTNAILPDWAWLLVALRLKDVAVTSVGELAMRRGRRGFGCPGHGFAAFHDARVIVKGCATPATTAYTLAFVQRIQPHVKSLMFGEAWAPSLVQTSSP